MNAPTEPTSSPSSFAERLGARALFAVVPFANDGVVLCADDGGPPLEVDLGSGQGRGLVEVLAAWAARPDHVFLFDDAKPVLKILLAAGVDVARPICLRTLALLVGEESAPRSVLSPAEARDRGLHLLAALPPRLAAVERDGQKKVARLECLVLRPFAALEHRGLFVDKERWRALVGEARTRATVARAEVMKLFGDVVQRDLFGEPQLNLDAEHEVKAALERLIGRPLDDVTKGTLARLGHDVGPALLAFREAWKIVTTYGDTFLEHIGKDGRVRAHFTPLGASTGRVASRDPNLQNLPGGEDFHACLLAPPGRKLVTADYGTCELRILADLSGDDAFLEAFQRGEDLHSAVATRMFGVEVTKQVRPELRARAKAINFGLMYGMGAAALGAQVGVARDEAEALLERYFAAYPSIRTWLEQSVDTALTRGYAETVLGRRLVFDPEVLSSKNARGELSRIAKNMPIQGTSADMTKLAMIRVHERLRAFTDAGLVNTIHDELVVECEAAEAEDVGHAVAAEMAAAHSTLLRRVPPAVDVHVGDHWMH